MTYHWLRNNEGFLLSLSLSVLPYIDIIPHNKIVEINHFLSSPLPLILPPKHIRPSKVKFIISISAKHKTLGYDLITFEVASQLLKKPFYHLCTFKTPYTDFHTFLCFGNSNLGNPTTLPARTDQLIFYVSSLKYLKNSHSNAYSQSLTQTTQTIN